MFKSRHQRNQNFGRSASFRLNERLKQWQCLRYCDWTSLAYFCDWTSLACFFCDWTSLTCFFCDWTSLAYFCDWTSLAYFCDWTSLACFCDWTSLTSSIWTLGLIGLILKRNCSFQGNLKSKQYIPKIKRTKSRRAFKCSMRAVWEHSKTRSYCKAYDVSDTLLAIGILRLDLIDMLTFPLALIGEHKLLNMKSTWLRITKFSQ